MGLQSSGAISLNDIHIEAGGSSGSYCTINDSDIRGLISKSSGAQMSFSEWYGASNVTTEGPNYVQCISPWQSGCTEYHFASLYVQFTGDFFQWWVWGSTANNSMTNPSTSQTWITWSGSTATMHYGRSGTVSGGWYYFVRNNANNYVNYLGDQWAQYAVYSIWRSTSSTYPF
tara:strand:+ start:6486 stop:7004 length:519 start_codon:yes stop_codon:yes gene_type:complete